MIKKLPWDKKEGDFIKFLDLINDSDNVLDIGANIGVMSYHFSKKLPNSTVHSFEPIPDNLNILKKVVKKFNLSNVKIYSFALGDKSEMVEMILPESKKVYFHGLSHVNSNNELQGLRYKVEMKKLDDIEELKDKKINAIKLDVEDFEYNVLIGAENLINKNRPIIYTELWDSDNKKQSLSFLDSLKYTCYINKKNQLIVYQDQVGFQNFFFVPNEYCEELKL